MEECYFHQHSSVAVFHIFKIVQMVSNRVKRLIKLIENGY